MDRELCAFVIDARQESSMLVYRRQLGESMLIDGDLCVTIVRIAEHFVELSVQDKTCSERARIYVGRQAPIGRGALATVIRADINSARLGFELPAGMEIVRCELQE